MPYEINFDQDNSIVYFTLKLGWVLQDYTVGQGEVITLLYQTEAKYLLVVTEGQVPGEKNLIAVATRGWTALKEMSFLRMTIVVNTNTFARALVNLMMKLTGMKVILVSDINEAREKIIEAEAQKQDS